MHIREWAQRAFILAIAVTAGWLGMPAPAAAQKDITPDNVRLVRGKLNQPRPGKAGDVTISRITATAWQVHEEGTSDFVLLSQDATHVSLVSANPPRRVLVLDLANNTFSEIENSATGRIFYMSADTCSWWTRRDPGTKCTCDLRTLRPLQGAVGMGEVTKKRKDIEDDANKELADLSANPIKIVRSMSNDIYVVDHHHGARSWLDAGYSAGACEYVAVVPGNVDFWEELKAKKWVRLVDRSGNPMQPADLPQTLGQEPDDPYRTLAWVLRKADGYCRSLMRPSPPPFAEFLWADWMRSRPELPLAKVAAATASSLWEPIAGEKKKQTKERREAAQQEMLNAALALARSPQAAGLPGYQGTQNLKDEACNPKGE